jgi:hypothetical protein
VDTVTDDRGQALVLAVLALGIAAVTVVGLVAAQDRILVDAHERRAGEAAAEAAGAALADAQVELLGSAPQTRADLDAFVTDVLVVDRSRAAADELAAANGAGPVRDLAILAAGRSLEVTLALGAHRQRVSIRTTCCRR